METTDSLALLANTALVQNKWIQDARITIYKGMLFAYSLDKKRSLLSEYYEDTAGQPPVPKSDDKSEAWAKADITFKEEMPIIDNVKLEPPVGRRNSLPGPHNIYRLLKELNPKGFDKHKSRLAPTRDSSQGR